jgi:endoglucanase
MKKLTCLFFILSIFILVGCGGEEEEGVVNSLSVSRTDLPIGPAGGTVTVNVFTNAASWKIINPGSDWLTISPATGGNAATVTLSVDTRTATPRITTLTLTAGNAKPIEIKVTQAASNFLFDLSSDLADLSFSSPGGSTPLKVTTSAPNWTLTADADWLEFSAVTGTSGATTISVTALENDTEATRATTITISADDAPSVSIAVSQKNSLFPNYNTSPIAPDNTGMSSTAVQLAAKIKLGWNIGNTMEAIGGETAWGNPKVSAALIDLVKENGFNAVRIPCSWDQYMQNSATAELKTEWLNRVKEVVQICVDRDMYVLLNIHWDGGWLENNCTAQKQDANNAKQKAFWEQIASHLRDFDEHLLFASANEPNVESATQMAVLNSYHQTFVNAVRSTGGRNSYRVLVIQGPSTDIEKTHNLMTTLPTDEAENRMMAEVHYYTPWNFCGLTKDESWGKMFYYWGEGNHSTTDIDRNPTWGEEDVVDDYFAMMKAQFVDKGIPVVMGEFSATRRLTLTGEQLTRHLESRAYYLKYVTKQAIANGLLPFFWDNGATGNDGSGIFNRHTNTVSDQQALDALIEGATP